MTDNNWVGIDYGSKLAGTTVIAYVKAKQLHIIQSEKKQDADKWLQEQIALIKPSYIMMDAPLSLPLAYFGDSDNYFYRECDKAMSAMSPMFLGGLTARAMRLCSSWEDLKVIETYPGYLARKILKIDDYNKKIPYKGQLNQYLSDLLAMDIHEDPINWHQVDAILCWYSGSRYNSNINEVFGDEKEGLIIV
jgi:predicted nuclease with RNAse H fold